MKKRKSGPMLNQVWLVVQENEGLITETFTQQRAAVARAKQLARQCPSVRTEVASYLVAPNSWKLISPTGDDR
ncbi:MAG TPA: hypothetical protein VHE81_11685 [Lacipirellulaceae bacterium]|nr:hypothetical protein [Lacipirellulaceae bacterium]